MVISLILMSYGVGCTPAEPRKPTPPPPSVQGIITDVTVVYPDGYDGVILIEFEDGRIQKLRQRNCQPLLFQKGKLNVIEYDSYGSIKNVKILE